MAKRKTAPAGARGEAARPAFGGRLKALREASGLTQEQLADKAGLHLGAVFKLEQGVREPTWATVQLLAAALSVSCEDFKEGPDAAAGKPRRRKQG